MLRVAVCDDMKSIRQDIRERLTKYSIQRNIDIYVDEYETGIDLIEAEKNQNTEHNLIFMDYELGDMSIDGIQTMKELRNMKKDTRVIFVSGYSSAAIDAYEVEAFRFIIKPIEEDKFNKAIDDFMKTINVSKIISVKADGEKYLFSERIITFVEANGKKSTIYFDDGREPVEVAETLAAIESRLSEKLFYRCHKTYIINLSKIQSHNRKYISLEMDYEIPISRTKYKEFDEVYTEYIKRLKGI